MTVQAFAYTALFVWSMLALAAAAWAVGRLRPPRHGPVRHLASLALPLRQSGSAASRRSGSPKGEGG